MMMLASRISLVRPAFTVATAFSEVAIWIAVSSAACVTALPLSVAARLIVDVSGAVTVAEAVRPSAMRISVVSPAVTVAAADKDAAICAPDAPPGGAMASIMAAQVLEPTESVAARVPVAVAVDHGSSSTAKLAAVYELDG